MKTIDLHYEGKVAVITGAASGMGLLASKELAAAGAKVVMCDVNGEALEREAAALAADGAVAQAGGEVAPCLCDVRRWEDAQAAAALALERFGRLDLLFCFAGRGIDGGRFGDVVRFGLSGIIGGVICFGFVRILCGDFLAASDGTRS